MTCTHKSSTTNLSPYYLLSYSHHPTFWKEDNTLTLQLDHTWSWYGEHERGSYHIGAYLSSIQHKILNPYNFVANSFKWFELV